MIFVVGFVLLGIASIPIAKWFLLAGLGLGAVVVLLLRLTRKA